MKKNGVLLKYASAKLRADPDIVLAALEENIQAQEFVSDRFLDSMRNPQTTITGSLFSNETYQKILTLLDCHTDQPNMKP